MVATHLVANHKLFGQSQTASHDPSQVQMSPRFQITPDYLWAKLTNMSVATHVLSTCHPGTRYYR